MKTPKINIYDTAAADGCKLSQKNVDKGVPQGPVLGPLPVT